MTDEPTKNPPEPPAPPAPPSEPSGVGFAAIRLPGEGAQQAPPSAYPPPPPGPPYTDYSRTLPGRGGGSSPTLIVGIAVLLTLVISFAVLLVFSLGPFAPPAPTSVAQPTPTPPVAVTARPSATAASTATPQASATASSGPTASAGPTATPIPSGDVIAVLLSHVPSAIAGSCTTTTGENKVLARAKCSARDGRIAVTYFLYADHDSMFATYEGFRAASEIEPNTGNCNDPATWPAESDFAISGQVSGRFLCTEAMGAPTIYWTDNRLNIFSEATDADSDYSRLVDFWIHDSGPNLTN